MVQTGSGPNRDNDQPKPQSSYEITAKILQTNQGRTDAERQELIDIIKRGGIRDQVTDAAMILGKNLGDNIPDLTKYLSELVTILINNEHDPKQRDAVKIAVRGVQKQFNNQLMSVAIEDPLPKNKQRAEQELPALETINSLKEQRKNALFHNDLSTLAMHLDILVRLHRGNMPNEQRTDKESSIRKLIENFLKTEHSTLLTQEQRDLVFKIAREPTKEAVTNAGLLRASIATLKSIDVVGKLCLKILQEKESSLDKLDDFDRTRVRISAAKILKEFKHISNPVREEYSKVTGMILHTLDETIPKRWLATVLRSEAA